MTFLSSGPWAQRYAAIKRYAAAHKIIASVVALIVLYGAYSGYRTLTAAPAVTTYVTATAATSTVVATLTETGQVSASQEITLSPKASGTVTGVYVTPGMHVYAGQVVARLDATTAIQSLKNAELALKNAEITYAQTTASSTLALNLVVAKNSVTNATISLQKARDEAYSSIATIYSDLGTVVSGVDSALHGYTVPGRTNQQNIDAFGDILEPYDDSISVYKTAAQNSYDAAYTAYNDAATAFKAANRSASNDALISLAQTAYVAAQSVASAAQDAHDFFDRASNDYSLYNLSASATLSNLLSTVGGYTTTVSGDLSTALSIQSSLVSAEQSLAQAQNSLQIAESGSNALTVQQAALSLQQAKDSVTNAQTTLDGYAVTAPFAGTIASVGVQTYDQAGSGTAVATLVTSRKTAKVTVNEVDASKIKVGQKATLTFDALPDISIAGTVASVDGVGTASQGVVSYGVVIGFDTPNDQVLPGMSVTADIITGTETGLAVPSTAVKTAGGRSYVEVFSPALAGSETSAGAPSATPPTRVDVVTGLTNDTETIITSGISAGTQVVTRTNSTGTAAPATATSAARSTSVFGGGGGTSGARILTR